MNIRILTIVLAAGALGAVEHAGAQRVPVPVLGRSTEVTLTDGTRLRGELIEATEVSLLLDRSSGPELTDLSQVRRIRIRRHGFSNRTAWTWVGIGALVSGLGMTAACTQVEDTSCGVVFPAVALSFGLVGGLFAASVAGSGWQEVPAAPETLRLYARFPQGAPPGFRR